MKVPYGTGKPRVLILRHCSKSSTPAKDSGSVSDNATFGEVSRNRQPHPVLRQVHGAVYTLLIYNDALCFLHILGMECSCYERRSNPTALRYLQ